ncbi:Spliceosome-associated protein 49 [Grifola frondosa]|uniref:Spliceosome-associated protein 49 n=1 Tax=Grifola frondosa TaxID=5627 RepID=A0A1C7MJ97_GRIFR|nr:Spliceosome-associated protein 49 [Grifola frondosa]
MSRPQDDRNQEATVYLGNLDERCSDALVWELMLQAGPVVNVHLPKDRISMAHQGYGFYQVMGQAHQGEQGIRVRRDGTTAKIARDPGSGKSKGYGFVSYTDFESSDAAIESMNGQFLMNKAITVQPGKNNALPVAARPPPAPMAFGPRPPMPGYPQAYQGQFAGALAAQPAPPVGFTPQQTIIPQQMPMGMPMPPQGMPGMVPPMMPPPPPGVPMYNPAAGFVPPPPPGYMPQGMPGMPMMPPPVACLTWPEHPCDLWSFSQMVTGSPQARASAQNARIEWFRVERARPQLLSRHPTGILDDDLRTSRCAGELIIGCCDD